MCASDIVIERLRRTEKGVGVGVMFGSAANGSDICEVHSSSDICFGLSAVWGRIVKQGILGPYLFLDCRHSLFSLARPDVPCLCSQTNACHQ